MSQVEKVKIMDARIVQPKPRYAVNEGALSVSNTSFQANNSSSSSLAWNINAPNQNVFMDRPVPVSTKIRGELTATCAKVVAGAAARVGLDYGVNCAVCAYPLHSLFSTLSATINNATTTSNVKDILYEMERITATKHNHKSKTTPVMLDKFLNYVDGKDQPASVLNGYGSALSNDNQPNGAYTGFKWVNADGSPRTVDPVWPIGTTVGETQKLYFELDVTENLMVSPFIWNESEEDSCGLFGINNIRIQANIGDPSRLLRLYNEPNDPQTTFSTVSFTGSNPFIDPRINCIFRTPSLSIPLPEQNIVPYMEFPRFVSNNQGVTIPAGATMKLKSQTVTLSQVPDLMLIYVKPNITDNKVGDYHLPIQTLSMQFDNVSGIMSSMTKEQLFHMSQRNGLDMDYNTYDGTAWSGNVTGGEVPLVGGFLVIRPGIDFALNNGSASGVGGNYTLQFDVEVQNQQGVAVNSPIVYLVAVNSGFFITSAGQSAITTAPLTEAEVIDAPVQGDTMSLKRYVGGSNFWSKLNSTLRKIASSPVTKEMAKLGKSLARASGDDRAKKAADVVEVLGYGKNTGGGITTGGRRKGSNYLKNLL